MRAAILLAAGGSTRFGAANKLFARHRGRCLLDHALRIARAAPVQRLIVVTGCQSHRVTQAVRRIDRRAVVVRAADHREGMGASLRAAAGRLRPIDREVLIVLADMPWLSSRLAAGIVAAAAPGDEIVRPAYRGRPGHPVLLRGAALGALARSTGDEGLRRGGYATRLIAADRHCVADIDRPDSVSRIPARLR